MAFRVSDVRTHTISISIAETEAVLIRTRQVQEGGVLVAWGKGLAGFGELCPSGIN